MPSLANQGWSGQTFVAVAPALEGTQVLLKSFQVREFQSIRDSNPVDVGDITCLVGKNEAGKTALLRALYRLNPINAGDDKFDVTDDYPRVRVTDYQLAIKRGKQHTSVIEAAFALEQDDLAQLEEHFGQGVLPTRALTIEKDYENKRLFELEVDEQIAGQTLLRRANLADELTATGVAWESLTDLSGVLDARATERQKEFSKALEAANALADPDEKTKAIAEAQPSQETAAARALRAELTTINERGVNDYIYTQYLAARVPQFLYFDEYYQMLGAENIEALQLRVNEKRLEPHDYPLLGLIELAGLQLSELVNPSRTQELKNRLQGASNHLTGKILKYWSQNKHLRLAFDVRPARPGDPVGMQKDTNIWAEVMDQKHFLNTALGTRSRGFVWFFSFLAWYSHLKNTTSQRIILLLDEPGLSLHAKAQADLLRYFEEELREHHQILYTTHSPFMVDVRHLERVRIVQDKSIDADAELAEADDGTKVLDDFLDASGDSLFPLRAALGYEIYQTLFLGPNSLIVEGASDLLYLQAVSAVLEQAGREALSSAWTITPVGGADKVPTFVSLIGSQEGLRVATLIDFQKQHVQMIENLYKKRLLKKNSVLTFADFTGKVESDIEDMFERDFYLGIVNAEYKSNLAKPIDPADLTAYHPRVLAAIEEYLKGNPLQGATFNHYRPARYLTEHLGTLGNQLSAATLDNFERAFNALNRLLA